MRWTKTSLARRIPNVLLAFGLLSVIAAAHVIGDARAQAPAKAPNKAPAKAPAKTPAPPPPRATSVANPHGDLRIACETCHTAESWTAMRSPSGFDHATTGFPLDGQHRSAACKDCHKTPIFSHVATACADCHRDVHDGRNGLRCQECHVPERWVDRSDAVRRHASTSFPLRGVHAVLECTRCHTGASEAHLAEVSSECVSCHSADYAATRSPDHAAAGYSTHCVDCHDASRTTWTGAGFDHASTGFPLTGAHRTLACAACHSSGTYAGLSADCVACHRANYDATTDPNHASAGFPTQCASCHNTSSWRGATFDHSTTGFPLTGAHAQTACTACHVNGQYAGTPTDCVACHRANYDATTDPNHAAAGFSTVCSACHNTTSWQGARFDHDSFFRIYSGAHQNRWSSCTQCHKNPSTYKEFTCFDCHGQSETNSRHTGVSNYTYESNACYSCHRGV